MKDSIQYILIASITLCLSCSVSIMIQTEENPNNDLNYSPNHSSNQAYGYGLINAIGSILPVAVLCFIMSCLVIPISVAFFL